ncbi:MAG: tail fiber domain-containing protein [Gammaproteobacteria bacterium]|nr:tail fiber domain-containing protein [Gammaproteobacteria bacterium]
MAVLHIGTEVSLAAVPKADISNNDIAYIWLNSYTRKFVFDSTATDATDTTNHVYYIRPSDYASAGVWVESVGADENQVWNANQIITGQLRSTNCTTATGSQYDLDNATIKLGGTQVDAAGSYAGVFIGLDSGLYKFYAGDGSNKYFNFDGTNISWKGINTELTAAGLFSASRIVATGGTIGSFTIGTYLYTGSKTAYNDANAGVHLGSDGLGIGNNVFTVSSAGALVATSASIIGNIYASTGTIANWAIAANYLTSTNIGLHSASAASDAQILIGHATSYASAKIGLKNDGSGKLADGKIYWDASGNITLDVPANAGAGVGVVYKGGKRWLYDFNPAWNGTVTPDGFNIFLGVEAGNLNMGATATNVVHASYNNGIGYRALNKLTLGSFNFAGGYYAGYELLTGDNNTLLGTQSGYWINTGSSNTYLGSIAGIDTTSGSSNFAGGHFALSQNTTGSSNVAVGYAAGMYQNNGSDYLQTPENSIYLGYETKSGSIATGGEDAITNEIVIGYNTIGNGANTVTLGNTSIGAFHCQVALTVDSDKRIKRNISPSFIGLDFINALNPITFQPKNPFDYPDEIKPCNYKDRIIKEKDEEGKEKLKLIKAEKRPVDDDKIYLGLTAQQVEEVMSVQGIDLELVTTSSGGKKAITYGNLIMPLITAVQELSQRIEQLESR